MVGDAGTTGVRIVEDATCLGCACLCDDIGLVVEGDRIIGAQRACDLGRGWFARAQADTSDGPRIKGRSACLDEVVGRAAEVLAASRSPVIVGSGSTVEAQRAVVAIADRIGAALGDEGPKLAAFQRIGAVSATLGEIRDRADLIVFDSMTWMRSLPRFRERFIDAPGRFVPEGRPGRTIVVFGHRNQGLLSDVDLGLTPDLIVDVNNRAIAYASLRAILDGATLDPDAVEARSGATLQALIDLADRLKRARYGVFVLGVRSPYAADAEAASALIRDLNRFTRFVGLQPTAGNPTEAMAGSVLAWQTGVAGAVDFALGYPRHLPLEETYDRINDGEADTVFFVGDIDRLDGRLLDDTILQLPRVVVGPISSRADDWDKAGWVPSPERRTLLATSDVLIPTARAGIDEGGTVARIDGVILPLRPPFPGRRPSQAEILRAIDARLAVMKLRKDPAR
jgi:formylmethanofuran dehydrogenase subunit B